MDKIESKKIVSELQSQIPHICVLCDEPMSNHTSFKIGGAADVFISPQNEDEAISAVSFLNENKIPYMVIGNGSNLLVSDDGIRGVVLSLGKNFSHLSCIDDTIYALSGTLLSRIASLALENELTGFEFASGIPGSLGGAIVMNAGAYGGEMKDVIVTTKYIDTDGCIKKCTRAEHEFLYRKSRFGNGEIILSSSIKLKKGNAAEIKALMNELSQRRKEKQPIELPSAGSTFKRPEGYFAAKLIDDAGLRGFRIGDAMVSDKHCGFVVNMGNATFKDVTSLISHVQNVVFNKFGVRLEPEVKIVG